MAQRIAAFLLIATQCATLGYFSETLGFPAVATIAAFLGAVSKLRLRISPRESFYLHSGLVVLFLLKYFVAPHEIRPSMSFWGTPEAYALGQALIVFQVLHIFRSGPRSLAVSGVSTPSSLTVTAAETTEEPSTDHSSDADLLSLWLPGLGIATMVFFGDLRVTSVGRDVFLAFSIAFACFCAVYYASSRTLIGERRPARQFVRFALRFGVLVCAVGLAAITSKSLYRYERQIDEFLQRFYTPFGHRNVMGFSSTARLNSILARRQSEEKQVVLQVFSAKAPGYLRGRAFDTLSRSEWRNSTGNRVLQPLERPRYERPEATEPVQWVSLTASVPVDECESLTCWPDRSLASRYFVPLGTVCLETPIEDIFTNSHGVFSSEGELPGHPYSAFYGAFPKDIGSFGDTERRCLVQVPADLDRRVHELAKRILAGKRSAREKIAAVVGYFRANYVYAWGIEIPPGEDPLTHFLIEKPAAHCEYFASGAALLLRLGGVPCRYVTGFVTEEKNALGGYWVARNRDAHAWVEAYDETAGWGIVEATPDAGVPDGAPASRFRQFGEFLRDSFLRFRFRLQRDGLKPLIRRVMAFVSSPPVLTILAISLVVWGIIRWKRRCRKPKQPQDPVLNEFRRLLRDMDLRLARLDIQRPGHETLTHFADRICEADIGNTDPAAVADWYRLYVSLRYSGNVSRQSVERLQQAGASVSRPQPT